MMTALAYKDDLESDAATLCVKRTRLNGIIRTATDGEQLDTFDKVIYDRWIALETERMSDKPLGPT